MSLDKLEIIWKMNEIKESIKKLNDNLQEDNFVIIKRMERIIDLLEKKESS
jgi:hypothetical protein